MILVSLAIEAFLNRLHLLLEADHLRIFGLDRSRKASYTGPRAGYRSVSSPDQLVLEDGGKGIEVPIFGLFIEGLLGHPL